MRRDTEQALIERFVALQAAGSTDLAPSAVVCDRAHYSDADNLAREVDVLFRHGPVLVGMAPDAPEPGDWFAAEVAGFPVLLVRGADGRMRAFANCCPHRGSQLASGRGSARRGFTCGFHAWSFERDSGRLIATPRACGGFEQLDGSGTGLRTLGVAEVAGLVFVQPDGGDPDTAVRELLGEALPELEAFGIAGFHRYDARRFELACNYKLAIDTFCEAYHIASLHRDTIAPHYFTSPSLTETYGDTTLMIGVRSTLADELQRPPTERRLLPHATTQFVIPPNAMLSHQLDHLQLWRIDPVPGDPGRCTLDVSLHAPAPIDERSARKWEKNLDILLDVTRREDFPRCEEAQRAMATGALSRLTFGRNEPALIAYHRAMDRRTGTAHVRAVAAEASPSVASAGPAERRPR